MRGRVKQRQSVWFSKITELNGNIDTERIYSNPVMKRVSVSSTSGLPEEIAAGIVPTYDRYITSFDVELYQFVEEGVVLWVDTEPQLNYDESLVVDERGEPITPPDYVIKKILYTQRGQISRVGIEHIGGVYG